MTITKENYSEAEKAHKIRLKELQSLVVWGDWKRVGEMLGIASQNAQKRFERINSKYHIETVNALEAVIKERMEGFSA